MSSIPFDYFTLIAASARPENVDFNVSLFKASRALRILRVAKLLSLIRLLRISRLLRYLQRWEELFDIAGSVLRIVNLIGTMLLLAHWNGCIQFLISYLQGSPENSWIALYRLQGQPVSVQYTWSLFKAISHMLCIGYGRFPPHTVGEAWLTILSMLAGATFYAIFIGHMSSLLMHIDSSGRLYNEKWNQMKEYLKYRKIPAKVKQRISDYYEHRYRGKFFDEQCILHDLSPPLRADVVKHNCSVLIKAVPFFKDADDTFLTQILAKLTFQVYLPDDVIVEEGSAGDYMYFIQHGIVEVSTGDGLLNYQLTEGDHFGEICLLTDMRCIATVQAVTICDLFALHHEDFASVAADYPHIKKMIEDVALQRFAEKREVIANFKTDQVNRMASSKPDVLSHSLINSQSVAATGADVRRLMSSRGGVTAARGQSLLSYGFHAMEERRRLSALQEEDEQDTF